MSFGLRQFKKKQDHEIADDKKIYVRNLIVGDDSAAFLTAISLHKKGESVKLLTSKPTNLELILNDWKCSPQSLRGLENRELFKEIFPEMNLAESSKIPLFYKDSDFKEFGGRSKPFELKDGEEYFTEIYTPLNEKDFFSDDDLELLKNLLEKDQLLKVINEIEKVTPTDLAEPANFKIHLSDHELVECENLYWSRSPKELFKLALDKEKLSEVFHNLVSKIQHRAVLKLRIGLEKPVCDYTETLFLPQSVTHEWGHFICDFQKNENAKNNVKQFMNVLCFVDEEELDHESLAKKIKLAKRVAARIFNDFKEVENAEQIAFEEFGYAKDINDEIFDELKSNEPNLKLIGSSSPVGPQFSKSQFLLRSMISVNELVK